MHRPLSFIWEYFVCFYDHPYTDWEPSEVSTGGGNATRSQNRPLLKAEGVLFDAIAVNALLRRGFAHTKRHQCLISC